VFKYNLNLVMSKLGKVKKGLMKDIIVSNAKLQERKKIIKSL